MVQEAPSPGDGGEASVVLVVVMTLTSSVTSTRISLDSVLGSWYWELCSSSVWGTSNTWFCWSSPRISNISNWGLGRRPKRFVCLLFGLDLFSCLPGGSQSLVCLMLNSQRKVIWKGGEDVRLRECGSHLEVTVEVCPLVAQPPPHHVQAVLVPPTGLARAPVKIRYQVSWHTTTSQHTPPPLLTCREPRPQPSVTVLGPAHPHPRVGVPVDGQPLLQVPVLLLRLYHHQRGVLPETVTELHGPEPVELEVSVEVTSRAHRLEGRGAECVWSGEVEEEEQESDGHHTFLPTDQFTSTGEMVRHYTCTDC